MVGCFTPTTAASELMGDIQMLFGFRDCWDFWEIKCLEPRPGSDRLVKSSIT